MFFRFFSYLSKWLPPHSGRSNAQVQKSTPAKPKLTSEERIMKQLRYSPLVFVGILLLSSLLSAQQAAVPTSAAAIVPRLVNFSGKAIDQGKALSGVTGATFAIYSEETGGSPLWLETQNVQADSKGNYTAQLGATKSEGLPLDLFTSGEARWLGVRVNGGEEQPRVLLLSVPYALKAADAQTLAGLPASAFMLAGTVAAGNSSFTATSPAQAATAAVSGTGTTDFLPLWTNNTGALGNSVLFQSGTGTTAKIGINTTAPAVTLDVNGAENVRGTLNLATTGTATATAGKNSVPLDFTASVFNSTASAAGALSLLYSSNNATPSETGLKISSKGVLTFAPGQTFPGGGPFCIATAGGFGSGGTTFVAPSFTVPAENKCTPWSGFTKTASTVILTTSGAACLSTTGKTLTVSVSSADPDFFGAGSAPSDYIQLTRSSSTGTFTGGTDQGAFAGNANQITCTASLLTLPDSHD